MLNARARLVVPLRFIAPNTLAADGGAGGAANAVAWDDLRIGPRRNGLLKSFSSISSIINNTTSFSVRPSECLAAAEQCFTQQGIFGMTGVEQREEDGWWGPDYDGSGQIQRAASGRNPYGDLQRLGLWEHDELSDKINLAAGQRRSQFINAMNIVGPDYDGNVNRRTVIDYEYRSDLFIPPFKMFDYPTVSKSPTYIPYADQIEVTVHWKAIDEIKAALLLGRGQGQSCPVCVGYGLAYWGQPYLELEYVVPNFSLPPVVTLPAWRTISYFHDIKFGPSAHNIALVKGTGASNKQQVTMAPIRIESMPSMVFVWVSDTALRDTGTGANVVKGFNMREYFGKISNFSVTLNERLRILSDRDPYSLYKLYRVYCPNSRMSFKVWSELRQMIVFRTDVLCTSAQQSVFSPTTITFKMDVERAIQNRSTERAECSQRINVLLWYANEALSLSSQSSAVTSLLLNPSDVREVRVGAGASAITEIMARNQ
jgi:hypothetical protein